MPSFATRVRCVRSNRAETVGGEIDSLKPEFLDKTKHMPPESSSDVKFEIGHVWFSAIVVTRKLLINDALQTRLQKAGLTATGK